VTRKLQLSGTRTQDVIRARTTFNLTLMGSPRPAASSFPEKGEWLGQTDRTVAFRLYNGAPLPHLWSTCRYLHASHTL